MESSGPRDRLLAQRGSVLRMNAFIRWGLKTIMTVFVTMALIVTAFSVVSLIEAVIGAI